MMNYLFATSIMALRNQSNALSVVSENLVNLNTTGYKRSSPRFVDLTIDNTLKSGLSVGQGKNLKNIRNYYATDGQISQTRNKMHGAILGPGFFVTHPNIDGPKINENNAFEYTSRGNFSYKAINETRETYLSDGLGNFVFGWPYNLQTNAFDKDDDFNSLKAIRIDRDTPVVGAQATDKIRMAAVFDVKSQIGQNTTFTANIYDGTGLQNNGQNDSRSLDFQFTKIDDKNWSVNVSGDNATIRQQPENLTFNEIGQLVGGEKANLFITWNNPVATREIAVNFAGTVQSSATSRLLKIDSNGRADGQLKSISLGDNGVVLGLLSNGQSAPIAKLPAGFIRNSFDMEQIDGPRFKTTLRSGEARLIDMEESDFINFVPSALEMSNADITQEFSEMILAQRSYNSAAQVVKTVDEMMKVVSNIR